MIRGGFGLLTRTNQGDGGIRAQSTNSPALFTLYFLQKMGHICLQRRNKVGDEYEVVLQSNSEYGIIKAQYFKGKLFLVVKWLGAKRV